MGCGDLPHVVVQDSLNYMNVMNAAKSTRTEGHLIELVHDDGASAGHLEPWEALVVDAVGNTIDFWRFKRNHGRVWALLYLRGKPSSAAEIQRALGLSKGAV